MRYGQLCPYLHEKGFALHNLASLPHIGVAGACRTATHGSGEKNGNLARRSARSSSSPRPGPAALSRRTRTTRLSAERSSGWGRRAPSPRSRSTIEPAFAMRQWVYEDLPLAQMKEHFDAIEASAYSVSLFTDWQGQKDPRGLDQEPHGGMTRPSRRPRSSSGRSARPGTSTPSPSSAPRTAPSSWACPGPGTSGCRTSGWASRRARQGAAVGVLRSARARGRRDPRAGEAARPDHATPP